MEKTCKNCSYFCPIYNSKESWIQRMKILSEKYPNMSEEEKATLANNTKLWNQEESLFGFCNNDLNCIESKIPNYINCKYHKP